MHRPTIRLAKKCALTLNSRVYNRAS